MAIEFAIEDRRVDGGKAHVVAVSGEVDLFTAPEFKQRVMAPIAAGVDRVVVDLTETTFIDSSSLGALIGAHRRLKSRGGRLIVACATEPIVKTFRITGLDSVFTIVDSPEAALSGRPRPRSLHGVDGGTGFPGADAQDDFSRARRSQILAELGRRLRREPDDVGLILPFDEVVDALGMVGETQLGLQTIPLDSVVGTVDRTRDFDRGFRPTTPRVRGRWQRIAAAQRRGEAFPPISVFRIGDLHFVRDGHHRVSVAKSLGREDIDAYVTDVRTRIGTGEALRLADLPLKDHERLFGERVPLDAGQHARVRPTDPWDWGRLAENVEAWGFRVTQERREYMDREEVGRLWFEEEFVPVVEALRSGGFIRSSESEGDAYMRFVGARYELLRTHEWSGEVIDRLQGVERRRRGKRRHRRRWGGGPRRWR